GELSHRLLREAAGGAGLARLVGGGGVGRAHAPGDLRRLSVRGATTSTPRGRSDSGITGWACVGGGAGAAALLSRSALCLRRVVERRPGRRPLPPPRARRHGRGRSSPSATPCLGARTAIAGRIRRSAQTGSPRVADRPSARLMTRFRAPPPRAC